MLSLWRVALAIALVTLGLSVVGSVVAASSAAASSDWAGSGFCATGAHTAAGAASPAPDTGSSFDGVEACGNAYGKGNNNNQGSVSYEGVVFDSVGFQCVELVMRYMYYAFGITPYKVNGNQVVTSYSGNLLTKETDPAQDGLPSIGDILSFAGPAPYGHTAIVIGVSGSRLTTLNENDTKNGLDTVPVRDGVVGGGVTGWLHVHTAIVSTSSSFLANATWVVLNGFRELIPHAWDDACWRDKDHFTVLLLSQSQISEIALSPSPGNCVVGPAVVHSSNGAIYYVNSTNTRHWIPDETSVEAIETAMTPAVASTAGVPDEDIQDLGMWPSGDVSLFPSGSNMPSVLDWRSITNTIIQYGSASYLVDGSGVRHWIPNVADYICRNVAEGHGVSISGIVSSQLNSLVSGGNDSCSIGPALLTESNGPASFFVDGSNVRWGIPDIPYYWYEYDTLGMHYSWETATITALPSGGNLSDPMVGKIIEGPSPHDNYYFIGTNLEKYWIPGSSVLNCLEGPGHNVRFFQQVALNVVNNFPNASNWAACS